MLNSVREHGGILNWCREVRVLCERIPACPLMMPAPWPRTDPGPSETRRVAHMAELVPFHKNSSAWLKLQ